MIAIQEMQDLLNMLQWGAMATLIGLPIIAFMVILVYARIADAETRVKNLIREIDSARMDREMNVTKRRKYESGVK